MFCASPALAGLLALSPQPAWTEELPKDAAPPANVDPAALAAQPTASSLEPHVAPEASSAWALDRTTPDDPWLAPSVALPKPSGPVVEETCDPWSGAATCTEEAHVLSDPWPAESPSSAASAPPGEDAQVADADLRLFLQGDDVRLEVDVDVEWVKRDVGTTCLPEEAEVRVRGTVNRQLVSGSKAGRVSPLDVWIVDLGAAEEPFD